MPFEVNPFAKARMTDVIVLSSKNRKPDENPGAKLSLEMTSSNDILAMFDGHLKSTLFTKDERTHGGDAQGSLDAVEPVSDMPNLTIIGEKIGQFGWDVEWTGYTLVVDLGLGGKRSNLEIGDCTVGHVRMHCKEGGTVVLKFDCESQDVSEAAFGKLAKLKATEISITLEPPEVFQTDVEAGADAPKKSRKQQDQQPASLTH